MTEPNRFDDDRLDELVREALDPDPHTVRRVIDTALRPARRTAPRLVWAAAASVVLAAAIVALSPWARREPPPPEPAQTEAIVISNQDGVLTVTTPSGCEWVSVGGDGS
jgi:hypothetical protein